MIESLSFETARGGLATACVIYRPMTYPAQYLPHCSSKRVWRFLEQKSG